MLKGREADDVYGGVVVFLFRKKTADEISGCLVGWEMGKRDRATTTTLRMAMTLTCVMRITPTVCRLKLTAAEPKAGSVSANTTGVLGRPLRLLEHAVYLPSQVREKYEIPMIYCTTIGGVLDRIGVLLPPSRFLYTFMSSSRPMEEKAMCPTHKLLSK